MKPTILLWKWRGWRNEYTSEHVNRMLRMLAKHMSIPYDVVCVTDDGRDIDCESVPLPGLPLEGIAGPNCYHRLGVFDSRWSDQFGSKVLSLDLDSVILGDLAPLLTDDGFKAARGYHSHVCGTLFQLRPGYREDVYHDFDPIESPKVIADTRYGYGPLSGSDQAWMSLKMPSAPTWDEADGVYWFKAMKPQRTIPANARVIYFAGNIKPWSKDLKLINHPLYRAYCE